MGESIGAVLTREDFMNHDFSSEIKPIKKNESIVQSTVELDDDEEKETNQKLSKEELILVDNILNKYSKKLGIGVDQIRNFYVLADIKPGFLLSTISNLQLEQTNSLLIGNDNKYLSSMYDELDAVIKSITHLSQDKGNSYYRNQGIELEINKRKLGAEKVEAMADLVNKGSKLEGTEYLLKDAMENLAVNKKFAIQKAIEVDGLNNRIIELNEQQELLLGMYRQSSQNAVGNKANLEQEIKNNSDSIKDLKEQLDLEQSKNDFLQRFIDKKQKIITPALAFENNIDAIPDTKPNLDRKKSEYISPSFDTKVEIAQKLQLLEKSKPISSQALSTALKGLKNFKDRDLSQYLASQPAKSKPVKQNPDKGVPMPDPLAREFTEAIESRKEQRNDPASGLEKMRKGVNESWLGRTVNGLPSVLSARLSAKQNKKK